MADFDPAIDKVLVHEGGSTFTDHPNDHGGATKFGISKNAFPDLDIANLTLAQAKDIYRTHYWNRIHGDAIADQSVAEVIFDTAVNMGVGAATRIVQYAVGATVDGVFGQMTLKAVNQASVRDFTSSFRLAQIARYAQICNVDKTQRPFLLGWINRALGNIA